MLVCQNIWMKKKLKLQHIASTCKGDTTRSMHENNITDPNEENKKIISHDDVKQM